ncbi:VOC family protein [Microbacterium sp. NPDC057944]|uniref:VOC family protein n=1 Tax=Microbacterium sp. NPDC057944 TaxID=3346286 RepID=UPI0036DD90D9
MTTLNPYISFHQNAREAMTFYQSALGGELRIDTFENYDMGLPPNEKHLVMHAQLETPDGLTLMGADTPSHMPYAAPAGISVSVSGDDEARLESIWNALAATGTITVPFETPPWGGRFGMLTDAFGIGWMVALNATATA